jgi:site-specific DNA-methyltransferase (adenine-specific)
MAVFRAFMKPSKGRCVLIMEVKEISISRLREYENNPRDNESAVEAVAESIKEFGFKVPLVIDNENVIIAGHTRLKAARKLRLESVPCVVADDLTPEQIKAFRLADNKTAELSEWDFEKLDAELSGIFGELEMARFGFDEPGEYEEEEEEEERPEIEFTKSLEEDHNYIVLFFDNDVDWLQAQSVFDIKPVKEYSTRKDGEVKKPVRGVGRIIDGADALKSLAGVMFQ